MWRKELFKYYKVSFIETKIYLKCVLNHCLQKFSLLCRNICGLAKKRKLVLAANITHNEGYSSSPVKSKPYS